MVSKNKTSGAAIVSIGFLASVIKSPAAYAATDIIYGDDFQGFDPLPCDSSLASQPSVGDYAKALDLCQVSDAPSIAGGLVSAAFTLPNGTGTPPSISHAVRSHFGTGTLPTFGAAMTILSTGAAAGKDDTNPAFQAFEPGAQSLTSSELPADWLTANGGKPPHPANCPQINSTVGVDPVMLTLQVRVPENAHSFSINANYFTSDFPESACTQYNDFFVLLLDSAYSGSSPNPVDKNIATYTRADSTMFPITVNLALDNTGLFTQCDNGTIGCSGPAPSTISTCTGTSELVGTGMDDPSVNACSTGGKVGGGTGWLVTRGNVIPGETITLRFAIWDTADGMSDSLVLLDHFRWSPKLISPGTSLN